MLKAKEDIMQKVDRLLFKLIFPDPDKLRVSVLI